MCAAVSLHIQCVYACMHASVQHSLPLGVFAYQGNRHNGSSSVVVVFCFGGWGGGIAKMMLTLTAHHYY